jgi:hypothetical protein
MKLKSRRGKNGKPYFSEENCKEFWDTVGILGTKNSTHLCEKKLIRFV